MKNAKTKLVLLDIDGTLVKSRGGALRAMTRAARRLFAADFSLEAVDRNGRLDPQIIAEGLRLNGVRAMPENLEAFRAQYLREFQSEVVDTRALAGALELVQRLRRTEGLLLGLLTGNYPEAARMKLRQVGIDPAWFAVNGFGDEAATRSALVRLAIKRAEKRLGRSLVGKEVLVIGDTPRDVEAAKDNGCLCAVVATGNYPIDVLRETAADLVVADLGDVEPLFDLALGPAAAG